MDKDILETALVDTVCPLCLKGAGSIIVMNTIPTKSNAKKVKDMHRKKTFSDKPCEECVEYMSKGFLIIEFDEDKSEDCKIENVYRTGKMFVIDSEIANDIFEDISMGVAFVSSKVCIELGLHKNK